MYSDEDGSASKQSQAAYNAQIRLLISVTSVLSWLGLAAAVANGEYSPGDLQFSLPLNQLSPLSWSKHLWASISLEHEDLMNSSQI